MLSLHEAHWDSLRWTRAPHPRNKTLYSLHDGRGNEYVFATLRWVRGHAVYVATAQWRWTLTHKGLWVQHVDVEADAAVSGTSSFRVKRDLRHRWRLALANGAEVRWHLAGLASADWVCESEAGEQLMFLSVEAGRDHPRFYDPFNVRGCISVAPAVREWPEAVLMLSLGWYLLLMRRLLASVRVPVMGGG